MSITPPLQRQHHWVFDMDGTLTQAVHDFAAIRRMLGIPAEADILGHLNQLPGAERERKRQQLWEHEHELARAARPANGAVALIKALHAKGAQLGILTRNDRSLALTTLKAIGLASCFAEDEVLGRDEATPKPDPAGLNHLAALWQLPPTQLVMVGDSIHDMEAGYRAGVTTLLVNYQGPLPLPWPDKVSHHFRDCEALLAAINSPAS